MFDLTAKEETRFWSCVDPWDALACWTWKGTLSNAGYPRFFATRDKKPKFWLAHRVAYELCVRPIPDSLTIDHLCSNKSCVNPHHLEAVTMRVNVQRGNTILVCEKGLHAMTSENERVHFWKGKRIRTCRLCACAWRRAYSKKAYWREKSQQIDMTDEIESSYLDSI